jgi:hypothetical protein
MDKPKVFNKKDDYPSDAVYIGRGTLFGNPYRIGIAGNRQQVIEKFKIYLNINPHLKHEIIKQLRGKNLLCHCAPELCHGDVLLAIANKPVSFL